ncbi:MAG: SGNH/GDSL hydrolase family protein [Clostridia bacterium]|nr:SGNH/GDSL hydrolase family protein [Clostridia bacterium]
MAENSKSAFWNVVKTASELSNGEVLEIDDNTVMHRKRMTFSCELGGDVADGFKLLLGHGRDCYAATWLELDGHELNVFHKYVDITNPVKESHGLKLNGFIKVVIDVDCGNANITVMTASGVYKRTDAPWAGRNGKVFASIEGGLVSNVKATWGCSDYGRSIYLFGDSYFNTGSNARWPYYLHRDGYNNCFMTGYPGMGAQRGIIDFRLAIERGQPQYAVWCLGMNNGDKDDKINPVWLDTAKEFVDACKNRNIVPILATIPSTPTVDNRYKNQWVMDSGCRYIDFNCAVGAHLDREWYPDMLYSDKVHPASLGAQALYMQVLTDFPEIMTK